MAPRFEPLFIDGPAGRLFGIHHPPAGEKRSAALYVPPFAEEMNRSRRMAALQARALAEAGIGAFILDLFGTGDSAGEFSEARWETWLGDIAAAADWLTTQGYRTLSLWGLQLGALLAVVAVSRDTKKYSRLVLWHPAPDGRAMLTQFLRIRVATAMAEGRQETTDALRAELEVGKPIEVAGYEIAPELARALSTARIGDPPLPPGLRIDWLELVGEAGDALSPAATRICDAWQKAELTVVTTAVPGPQFWTLQEITLAPALLAETSRIVIA